MRPTTEEIKNLVNTYLVSNGINAEFNLISKARRIEGEVYSDDDGVLERYRKIQRAFFSQKDKTEREIETLIGIEAEEDDLEDVFSWLDVKFYSNKKEIEEKTTEALKEKGFCRYESGNIFVIKAGTVGCGEITIRDTGYGYCDESIYLVFFSSEN